MNRYKVIKTTIMDEWGVIYAKSKREAVAEAEDGDIDDLDNDVHFEKMDVELVEENINENKRGSRGLTRSEVRELWKNKYGLSTVISYGVDFIKSICGDFGVKFNPDWVYTENTYHEVSSGKPRVDGEVFLRAVCDANGIEPIKEYLDLADEMEGVGSRRRAISEAFLGGE